MLLMEKKGRHSTVQVTSCECCFRTNAVDGTCANFLLQNGADVNAVDERKGRHSIAQLRMDMLTLSRSYSRTVLTWMLFRRKTIGRH